MRELSQQYLDAASTGGDPLLLLRLINAHGARLYGDRMPPEEASGLAAAPGADGQWLADGSRLAGEGSLNLLDRGAKVLSWGRLRETLTPMSGSLAASLRGEEAASLSVVLGGEGEGDAPGSLARLEALENLLGARAQLLAGYAGLASRHYLLRFNGRVTAYSLERGRLTLTLGAL